MAPNHLSEAERVTAQIRDMGCGAFQLVTAHRVGVAQVQKFFTVSLHTGVWVPLGDMARCGCLAEERVPKYPVALHKLST